MVSQHCNCSFQLYWRVRNADRVPLEGPKCISQSQVISWEMISLPWPVDIAQVDTVSMTACATYSHTNSTVNLFTTHCCCSATIGPFFGNWTFGSTQKKEQKYRVVSSGDTFAFVRLFLLIIPSKSGRKAISSPFLECQARDDDI